MKVRPAVTSRVVRIPRPSETPSSLSASAGIPAETGAAAFVPNHGGRTRAARQFFVFTAAITAIYLLFVDLTYSSSSPGVRDDLLGIGLLSAMWATFVVVNWMLTLSRAPRAVRREADSFTVRDSYGRTHRFPRPPESELTVLQRYPASWFGPEPTELVRLVSPGGPSATYLVERDFFSA